MEQAEIDDLLARYGAAEQRIGANLVELDDHPTYGLLASDTLSGVTAEQLGGSVAEVPRMWALLDALRRHLDVARSTRGRGKVNTERRTQLVHLLTGQSVVVDVVDTPLTKRDIAQAGSAERRFTIERVIDEIRDLYTPLRDGIAAIDEVWRDVLPRLDAADTTLGDLKDELTELGTSEPLVSMGLRRLDELRTAVMDDPLSIESDAGPKLDELVRDAAHHVGELRQSHDELAVDLVRTEELVASARALRARAATAHAEVLAKIAPPHDISRAPSEAFIDQLADQAAELRRSTGPWQHTRQWLTGWLDRAERLVDQLTRVELRNRRPLEKRSQLRGLLKAYRAKAAAVGVIERDHVADLADAAHSELYTSPTDIGRAEDLVAQLAQVITDPAGSDSNGGGSA